MLKFIKNLIDADNKYYQKNITINNSLFWIYDIKKENGYKKALWIIKNKTEYINCKDLITGNRALHFSAKNNHMQIASDLLLAGADPFLRNDKGFTALDIAEMNGYHEVAELIKSYMDKGKDR